MQEGAPNTTSAAADLERVFADGITRYQLAMAFTQGARALAYRDLPTRRGQWLNVAAAMLGCAEAVRRRRRVRRGDTSPLTQVGPTSVATAMSLAAVPKGTAEAPRAVLWTNLQPQWVAAGVSVFARGTAERVRGLTLATLPYLVGPGRRKVGQLGIGMRVGTGFVSFVSIAEATARRLRATANQIDRTAGQLVEERASLARRIEDERIRAEVLERTAVEMRIIRDLVSHDREAASARAAAQESLLRGWVTGEVALFAAADGAVEDLATVADAVERFDAAARRIEMVYRVAATGPLVVHSLVSGVRSTRWLAAAALLHAAGVCRELIRPSPRRIAVAVSDVVMVAIAVGVEAQVLSEDVSRGARPVAPEPLFGYAASIAPCAGTVNAEPGPARAVTGALAMVLGLSALSLPGPRSQRVLFGMERIVMAAGGSWFTHWVRDVILVQTERLGATTRDLVEARTEAAQAAARERAHLLVHDSALQVLLWVQKPDLDDDQLREWLDRESERLRSPVERNAARQSLRPALHDLMEGFGRLGMQPRLRIDGSTDGVAASSVSALVEVANEALTNVYKHSSDRSPEVALHCGQGVRLTVTNTLDDDVAASPGLGTAGMRSRISTLGGTFAARQEGERYVVRVDVPGSTHGRQR